MRIIEDLNQIERDLNSVITIGTFDGVHLAHQRIITKLMENAKAEGKRSIIITFEPHPKKVIDEKFGIHILTTLEEKIQILTGFDPDMVIIVKFDTTFSKIAPISFIKDLIYEKIGFNEMVLGFDHGFGNKRGGNIGLLENLKNDLSFKLDIIEPIIIENVKVSSTEIRKALLNGNMEKANEFLGRPYSVSGFVIRGDERGRTIGYPTANIQPDNPDKLIPKPGVYFIRAIYAGEKYFGCLNIGKRPTFTDSEKMFIEANIFDFNKDIYSRNLNVEFLKFLREEKKFDGKESLLLQLKKDKEYCFELINKINFN